MKEQILCGKEVLIYGDESKDENIMIVDKNTDEILFKEGWINAHHKRHHMFNLFSHPTY